MKAEQEQLNASTSSSWEVMSVHGFLELTYIYICSFHSRKVLSCKHWEMEKHTKTLTREMESCRLIYMEAAVGHGGMTISVIPSTISTTLFMEGRRAGSS